MPPKAQGSVCAVIGSKRKVVEESDSFFHVLDMIMGIITLCVFVLSLLGVKNVYSSGTVAC